MIFLLSSTISWQSWSHVYRHEFHASVDTNNLMFSESGIYHWDQIPPCTLFWKYSWKLSFLNKRGSTPFNSPKRPQTIGSPDKKMPEYLPNWPPEVQMECATSREKASEIIQHNITSPWGSWKIHNEGWSALWQVLHSQYPRRFLHLPQVQVFSNPHILLSVQFSEGLQDFRRNFRVE